MWGLGGLRVWGGLVVVVGGSGVVDDGSGVVDDGSGVVDDGGIVDGDVHGGDIVEGGGIGIVGGVSDGCHVVCGRLLVRGGVWLVIGGGVVDS